MLPFSNKEKGNHRKSPKQKLNRLTILTSVCSVGLRLLIQREGSKLCPELGLLATESGLSEATSIKTSPGTMSGFCGICMTHKKKMFITYRCVPRCAFFLFWNIKQREARGFQPCYYKHCCLSPFQTRIVQHLFCYPYDHSLD